MLRERRRLASGIAPLLAVGVAVGLVDVRSATPALAVANNLALYLNIDDCWSNQKWTRS